MISLSECKKTYSLRQDRLFAERETMRLAVLDEVCSALREIGKLYASSVSRLYVFGSLAIPGRFRKSSDIDIAVEWRETGASPGLWRDIEGRLGRDVDFRELGNDLFSRRVRERGLVVYESGSR